MPICPLHPPLVLPFGPPFLAVSPSQSARSRRTRRHASRSHAYAQHVKSQPQVSTPCLGQTAMQSCGVYCNVAAGHTADFFWLCAYSCAVTATTTPKMKPSPRNSAPVLNASSWVSRCKHRKTLLLGGGRGQDCVCDYRRDRVHALKL